MRIFSIFKPIYPELLCSVAKKMGVVLPVGYSHPQEDYMLKSDKHPIFVVADGVTLELDKNGQYPNPSGSGELARVFCQAVITEAEKRYDSFTRNDLPAIFEAGNIEADKCNKRYGHVAGSLNYVDFDYFAATTSFGLIKDGILYWWSLCDAGVALFDKNGTNKLVSPVCWLPERRKKYLPEGWSEMDPLERKKTVRKAYRNGVNQEGEAIGYGVITGEPAASRYLNTGETKLSEGDIAMIYTDGYENYITIPDFVRIFTEWADPDGELERLSDGKMKEDSDKYGHERSLFVVKA